MKLPENNPSKRNLLILALLGTFAVAYGVWIGVYDPIRRNRDKAAQQAGLLETDLQVARTQIARMGAVRRELNQVLGELRERSEQDMVHPRLGNYLLHAREIVMRYGAEAGVPSIQVAEIGLQDPPLQPKKKSANAVRLYSVRVTAKCGLDVLVSWFRAMESENRLLSISQFTLAAQAEDPMNHLVQFDVQWPVWTDPGVQEQIRRAADDVLGDNAS